MISQRASFAGQLLTLAIRPTLVCMLLIGYRLNCIYRLFKAMSWLPILGFAYYSWIDTGEIIAQRIREKYNTGEVATHIQADGRLVRRGIFNVEGGTCCEL